MTDLDDDLRSEWWAGWFLGFAAGAAVTGILLTIVEVLCG